MKTDFIDKFRDKQTLKDWLTENPNICILPFMHFDIETNGDMKPCCIGSPIEDETGKPLNIKDHTFNQLWNHPSRHKFVEDLISGKKPKQCSKCWKQTKQENSKRVHFSTNGKTIDTARQAYENGIENQPYELKWLDIFPGNTCNLKCRICWSDYSSLWAKDWHKKNIMDGNTPAGTPFKSTEEFKYNQTCQWIDDPNVWASIDDETFKHLEVIHILGGEPLMATGHFDMLQKLVDKGYSKNIKVEYNTNGTYFFTDSQLEIIKKFKRLQVNVSIDDLGARFEYQRKNAVWDEVEVNLKKFIALGAKDSMNAIIGVTPAISIMNVYYVKEYLHFIDSLGMDMERISPNHFVFSPGLDIRELSYDQRQQVLAKIKPTRPIENCLWLNIIVSRLESDDYVKPAMEHRGWRIDQFDVIRKESFQEIFPEMYEIIKTDNLQSS